MNRAKPLPKFQFIIFALLAALCALTAAARDVEVALRLPGTLAKAPELQEPATVTRLRVSGEMAPADFYFLRDGGFEALAALDLSEATVGELPPFALTGTKAATITLPQGLKAVGEGALAASALTRLDLPDGVTLLGDAALADCPALEEVTLPEGLNAVGHWAFRGCTGLKSVALPSSLTRLGSEAFAASGLATADLKAASRLAEIPDWAFACCPSLASVTLPEGLQRVGRGAFAAETSLRLVDAVATAAVPEAAPQAFAVTPQRLADLRCAREMVDAYKADPRWGLFHVVAEGAGLGEVSADALAPLRVTADGTVATLAAPRPIAAVEAAEPSGRSLRFLFAQPSPTASVDVAALCPAGGVALLRAVYADGSRSEAVKVALRP